MDAAPIYERTWSKGSLCSYHERKVAGVLRSLFGGTIVAFSHQGGASRAVLQYLPGLKRLGHDVYLVEPVGEAALRPAGAPLARMTDAAYFRLVVALFGSSGPLRHF